MPPTRPPSGLTAAAALVGLLVAAGCARKGGCTGDYCGTLVIATGGEPDVLLPAVSDRSITRDVTDQLFLRSEEHTSELQSRLHLVCRLLLEKKKKQPNPNTLLAAHTPADILVSLPYLASS